MKFIYGMQVNIEVFYKLVLSFWVCLARLEVPKVRSLYIFAVSPEKYSNEADFLPAYKH